MLTKTNSVLTKTLTFARRVSYRGPWATRCTDVPSAYHKSIKFKAQSTKWLIFDLSLYICLFGIKHYISLGVLLYSLHIDCPLIAYCLLPIGGRACKSRRSIRMLPLRIHEQHACHASICLHYKSKCQYSIHVCQGDTKHRTHVQGPRFKLQSVPGKCSESNPI